MATNNYMPMGRNPRSGGAGQAASYKKGGATTKVAGVMKSGGTMKQGGGRIDRLANRANRISDRMANIKEDMPDEGVLPPFAQRYGDKLNKKYARNENRLERVTKKIDTINSKNNPRVPPEKPNNPLNRAKNGGAKYQDKGAVTAVKAGAIAAGKAASKAAASAARPKMMKKIVKIKR